MAWRDRADEAWGTARATAEHALQHEKVQRAKELAIEELRDLDLRALADSLTASAGVRDSNGQIKRWRVVKAAANPRATAGKVARGLGREVLRRRRERSDPVDGKARLQKDAPRRPSRRPDRPR